MRVHSEHDTTRISKFHQVHIQFRALSALEVNLPKTKMKWFSFAIENLVRRAKFHLLSYFYTGLIYLLHRVNQLMPEVPTTMNDFIILYCFEKTGDDRSTGESELYSVAVIASQCLPRDTHAIIYSKGLPDTVCPARWKALPNFEDFVINGFSSMVLMTSR